MEHKNKEKSKMTKGVGFKKKKRLSIDSKLRILKKFKINNLQSSFSSKEIVKNASMYVVHVYILHFVHVAELQSLKVFFYCEKRVTSTFNFL